MLAFPITGLPVEAILPALREALAARPSAVLEAPPGAGKTTLVPLHLLAEPWLAGRRILMLEPRRLAARAAAARMSELLGENVGRTVGYAVRFERRTSRDTRIEVVTEGLLTRYLQRDPALDGYGCVIFDEFHERSLDGDLGLALCLEVQGSLRPDLKLLVMSATLDGAAVADILGSAPIVRSAGRLFPVRVEYVAGDPAEPIELRAARAVDLALGASTGSILAFLPGAREIRRTTNLLATGPGPARPPVHPLYGDLSRAEQDAAIRPGGRRIVLATNIAETSLTIEGVSVVIDGGLERRARFAPRTGMSRLVTVPISHASAEQRKGRAGRLGPGLCYRLWSIEEDRGRPVQRPAEIEEADLAPLALELAAIRPGGRRIVLATNIAETSLTIEGVSVVIDGGLERRARFAPRTGMSRLVTVPISRASAEQRKGRAGRLGPGLCYRLWSIEEDRGRPVQRPAEIEEADLAPLALELAAWGVREPATLRLPTQPPAGPFAQARSLLRELGALGPDGAITAHGRAMAELPLHPRLAHMCLSALAHGMAGTAVAVAALLSGRDPDRDRSDADLARRLELMRAGSEGERVRRQLGRALGGVAGVARAGEVGAVASLAFPDRLAQARPGGAGAFRLANGRGARLDRADPLAREAWLAVADLEDGGAEARIRLAAALSFAELEALHGDRFTAEAEIRFELREEAVIARRVVRLGALVVKEQPLLDADPGRIAEVLAEAVRARGLDRLPWSDAARQLQARVALLRRVDLEGWPDLGDPGLLDGLTEWLGPELFGLRRLSEVAGLDLQAILLRRLDHAQRQALDRLAPAQLAVPSGRRLAVDYTADPPVLAVKLQELFGLATTPTVNGGRTPVTLRLLSPAQRPVAVTADLAGFWRTGYPSVRKELRGRYPKHPWPEDPLTAPASHRARAAARRPDSGRSGAG